MPSTKCPSLGTLPLLNVPSAINGWCLSHHTIYRCKGDVVVVGTDPSDRFAVEGITVLVIGKLLKRELLPAVDSNLLHEVQQQSNSVLLPYNVARLLPESDCNQLQLTTCLTTFKSVSPYLCLFCMLTYAWLWAVDCWDSKHALTILLPNPAPGSLPV
jgi:hypothetical protein